MTYRCLNYSEKIDRSCLLYLEDPFLFKEQFTFLVLFSFKAPSVVVHGSAFYVTILIQIECRRGFGVLGPSGPLTHASCALGSAVP